MWGFFSIEENHEFGRFTILIEVNYLGVFSPKVS